MNGPAKKRGKDKEYFDRLKRIDDESKEPETPESLHTRLEIGELMTDDEERNKANDEDTPFPACTRPRDNHDPDFD